MHNQAQATSKSADNVNLKIYCVVVTYNAEKWIEKCLSSLLDSTVPTNIIVVDNYSTDLTVQYIKRFSSVVCIELKQNIGFGQANNLGIGYALNAEADYVFLLNQDAYIQDGCLENLVEVAQKNEDYGILSPIHLNGDGTELDFGFIGYLYSEPTNAFISDAILNRNIKDVYPSPFLNAAAWLVTQKLLMNVGGFDPLFFMYGEDVDLCQRALFHHFQIGLVPDARIHHCRVRIDKPFAFQAKPALQITFQYALFLNRLKNPSRNFLAELLKISLRNSFSIINAMRFFRLSHILILLESYLKVLCNLYRVWYHRNRAMTKGSHWLLIHNELTDSKKSGG